MYSIEYLIEVIRYRARMMFGMDADATVNDLTKLVRSEISLLQKIPKASSLAEENWANNRRQIRKFLSSNDPRLFYKCAALKATMIVENIAYTSIELNRLRQSAKWAERWSPAVIESKKLAPLPHPLLPETSGNTLHHVFHLSVFEEIANFRVNDARTIVEFGGGYGNICRLTHRLGFTGKYVIFDLPELSILQRFYLSSNGIKVYRNVSEFKSVDSGVLCISTVAELMDVIPSDGVDVFIATWSLSETPMEVRDAMKPALKAASHLLLAYQDKFEGIDNRKYFKDIADHLGVKATDWEIDFLPGNRYLIMSK